MDIVFSLAPIKTMSKTLARMPDLDPAKAPEFLANMGQFAKNVSAIFRSIKFHVVVPPEIIPHIDWLIEYETTLPPDAIEEIISTLRSSDPVTQKANCQRLSDMFRQVGIAIDETLEDIEKVLANIQLPIRTFDNLTVH